MEAKKEKAYELFLSGMSITKASKEAGIDERTLSRLLKKRNIDTKVHSRKYRFNEDFFEKIDTENKAYWLGFIYADGCIRENQGKDKNKGLGLEITLKEEDRLHLEKFIAHIGISDNSIIKDKLSKAKGKEYKSCKVVINSTKMCKDLISLGATQRKSLTLKFPKEQCLNIEFHKHFLRGYFDGDGNIGVRNTQRYRDCPRITLLGTEDFLNSVKSFCESNLGVSNVKLQSRKNGNVYTYQKTGDNAKEILRYMYDGASIYLERKYKIYEQILPS